MNRVLFFSLLLLLPAFQNFSRVAENSPSASGSFQITTAGSPTKKIEFSVTTRDNQTVGEMTFLDVAPVSEFGQRAEPSPTDAQPFFLRANFDCLIVMGHRAVISGSVTQANDSKYIGRRLLLVVQDGDLLSPPQRDKLTFGIYRSTSKHWLPTDSERPNEENGPLMWMTQDAERSEDKPVFSATAFSPKNESVGCQSFSISSFSFIDARQGRGTIQVQP